jgi:hypothetical protein
MALRSTHPVTKISTTNLTGGRGLPERKATNLTAICGNLDVLQPYGPPRPDTGICLPLFT